jgi:hypothetical protein
MARTTLYNLVRQTRAEPLPSRVITHLEFYTDHPDLFTVEEKHKGTVKNRLAYQNYDLSSVLLLWQRRGFVLYGQYIEYPNVLITTPSSTTYIAGPQRVRKRVVDNVYYVDVTLSSLGFSGEEDQDWTWVLKYNGQGSRFRSGVRDGNFVVDCTITSTGFSGAEDQDWENLTTASGGGALTLFRDGVRNNAYVIDKALTSTGFSGTEDVDWENIRKHKPV